MRRDLCSRRVYYVVKHPPRSTLFRSSGCYVRPYLIGERAYAQQSGETSQKHSSRTLATKM